MTGKTGFYHFDLPEDCGSSQVVLQAVISQGLTAIVENIRLLHYVLYANKSLHH